MATADDVDAADEEEEAEVGGSGGSGVMAPTTPPPAAATLVIIASGGGVCGGGTGSLLERERNSGRTIDGVDGDWLCCCCVAPAMDVNDELRMRWLSGMPGDLFFF